MNANFQTESTENVIFPVTNCETFWNKLYAKQQNFILILSTVKQVWDVINYVTRVSSHWFLE